MIVLIVLLMIAALIVIESRSFSISLAALAAAGILVAALLWLAQAALPAILQLAAVPIIIFILARVLSRRLKSDPPAEKEIIPTVASLVFILLALISNYYLFRSFPVNLPQPSALHEIRIMDWIGAGAVLIAAIIGALALMRKEEGEKKL